MSITKRRKHENVQCWCLPLLTPKATFERSRDSNCHKRTEWYTYKTNSSHERTVPGWAIALASLSRHRPSVDGPKAANIGNYSCIDPPKAKGATIKVINYHIVTIPAPAAEQSKDTAGWSVDFDAIGINPEKSSSRILLTEPAA
jgi:hypothetical protein